MTGLHPPLQSNGLTLVGDPSENGVGFAACVWLFCSEATFCKKVATNYIIFPL